MREREGVRSEGTGREVSTAQDGDIYVSYHLERTLGRLCWGCRTAGSSADELVGIGLGGGREGSSRRDERGRRREEREEERG